MSIRQRICYEPACDVCERTLFALDLDESVFETERDAVGAWENNDLYHDADAGVFICDECEEKLHG